MRLPLASFLGTDHPMNLYRRDYLAGYSDHVLPRWLHRIAEADEGELLLKT